jgi:hypothetical protein
MSCTPCLPSKHFQLFTVNSFPSVVALLVSLAIATGCGSASANSKANTNTGSPAPPLIGITMQTLPSATVESLYSATLAATGGVPPYSWEISAGALPAGFVLASNNGVLSGMTNQIGTFAFQATVTDSQEQAATASLSILVMGTIPPPVSITTQTLQSATVESPYSATLAATGGVPPYSWEISSGVLPAGFVLKSNRGVLSGMTTQIGTFPFQIGVTDSQGVGANASLFIVVLGDPPPPLDINTQTLPSAMAESPYSATLVAIGGVPPYSWEISSGVLPAGFVLESNNGLLSGMTTQIGTFAFQAEVVDSQGSSASTSLSVLVQGTPEGSEFYVSPSGSDSNLGTQASSWLTIQHAVDSFSLGANGTTIHVAAGTYSDLNNCATSGYTDVNICVSRGGISASVRLVIECDVPWSVPSSSGCLLRGNNSTQGISVEANNVDVMGFDYGNLPNALTGIGIFCSAERGPGPCAQGNSVHILGNYVHDIGSTANDGGAGGVGCPGAWRGGGILAGSRHGGYNTTDTEVIGNRVTTIGSETLRTTGSCNYTHGIYMDTASGIVENNIIEDTAATGLEVYSYPCNEIVTNNVVLRSGRTNLQLAGGDCGDPTPNLAQGWNTVTNNILDDSVNDYGLILGTGVSGENACTVSTPTLVSNNLLFGNALGDYSGTSGCAAPTNTLSEAPTSTFTNYLGDEDDVLTLKKGSAAINAGTTTCATGAPYTVCTSVVDFEGYPWNTLRDIGAYAYGSVPQD